MIFNMVKKGLKGKMTEKEQKIIEILEIANNVVVVEDLELLKELSKH